MQLRIASNATYGDDLTTEKINPGRSVSSPVPNTVNSRLSRSNGRGDEEVEVYGIADRIDLEERGSRGRDCSRVRYHRDHVGRLLHALGWSHQKLQKRARERKKLTFAASSWKTCRG
jgi:Winged helix-turn helix